MASWQELRKINNSVCLREIVINFVLMVTIFLGMAAGKGMPLLLFSFGLLQGLVIFRLFVLAHEASHGTAHRNKLINRLIGELCSSFAFWPFSVWKITHYHHHAWSNHPKKENSWRALSIQEYESLSFTLRFFYRATRTFFAMVSTFPYMLFSLKDCFIKNRYKESRSKRSVNLAYSAFFLLVPIFIFIVTPLVLWGSQSLLWTLLIPQLVFHICLSVITLLHHTHPQAHIFAVSEWNRKDAALKGTYYLRFPKLIESMIYHINCHPVHHLDAAIPFYRLRDAHQSLHAEIPQRDLPFSLTLLWRTTAICHLVDDSNSQGAAPSRWVRFQRKSDTWI